MHCIKTIAARVIARANNGHILIALVRLECLRSHSPTCRLSILSLQVGNLDTAGHQVNSVYGSACVCANHCSMTWLMLVPAGICQQLLETM